MATLTTSAATAADEKVSLDLNCYPKISSNIQQPWDAADIYFIESASFGDQPAIINDQWGALACFLASQESSAKSIYSWSDSFCSLKAARENNQKNNHPPYTDSPTEIVFDKDLPDFPANTDSVWIQCPKSFDQLHWWLLQAHQQLGPGIPVYLAGMAKHIPVKWLKWIEQHNDDYQQHPIKKKARLMHFRLGDALPPLQELKSYEGIDHQPISALPGVFSRDHMDIGSRFFIEQLSLLSPLKGKIIDLGCGNGLLSASILSFTDNRSVQLILSDDSSLALTSAKMNLESRGYHTAEYHHTDALLNIEHQADTILCNPPFHSGNRISTTAAERMFKQATNCLNNNGQLLVIANRHLPYAPLLKKAFQQVKILKSDSKFVIYQCRAAKRK